MNKALIQKFKKIFKSPPQIISSAPGRINIIGEHTDYNQGYVLPAAINLRSYLLAAKTRGEEVVVFSENFNQQKSFALRNIIPSSSKNWIEYVKAIFWVLQEKGIEVGGVKALVASDIPLEAGLSSSAAFEVSLFFGLKGLFGFNLSEEKIAHLAQKAENEFVGVKCGLMDQYVSIFGQKEKALFLDCQNLQFRLIPFRLKKQGLSLVVYDSSRHRELASSFYNKRRQEAELALKILNQAGLASYQEASLKTLEDLKSQMDETLYKRARHVISENERVRKAVEALEKDNFSLLGQLLFQSHQSLKDDYQVSCPELDLLYEKGREFPGCMGARLTGAGFGGSGIALVKNNRLKAFKHILLQEVEKKNFPLPRFYSVEVGNGARIG